MLHKKGKKLKGEDSLRGCVLKRLWLQLETPHMALRNCTLIHVHKRSIVSDSGMVKSKTNMKIPILQMREFRHSHCTLHPNLACALAHAPPYQVGGWVCRGRG